MLQNATEDSFKRDVLESELPVLVDFWAEWCQPCKAMVPVLEAIAAKYQGRVRVVKVDIDANPDLGMQYGVRGLPTLMLFEHGKVKGVRSGAVPSSGVEALLA
jgi:thioredoxin 1